jgi:hypothetical protein
MRKDVLLLPTLAPSTPRLVSASYHSYFVPSANWSLYIDAVETDARCLDFISIVQPQSFEHVSRVAGRSSRR